MAAKTFIKIKRGLLSPEHYRNMGTAVWLYLHILDRTNWEEGVLFEYRDQDVADMLEIPKRTIRSWRQKLETHGYIACSQSLHSLKVFVHKWSDPREKWEMNGKDKPDEFPPPLLPEEEMPAEPRTPYTILLDAFEKESGTYSGGNLKPRDNEALVRLVKSECEPDDIIVAIKYNRSKGFPVVGVASIENGAIIERDKRTNVSTPHEEKAAANY